jgi:hypothetical protein
MKITPPPAAAVPSLKEQHARKCFLLGITEEWKVDRLWEEYKARVAAARAAEAYQPGNRHGRGDGA